MKTSVKILGGCIVLAIAVLGFKFYLAHLEVVTTENGQAIEQQEKPAYYVPPAEKTSCENGGKCFLYTNEEYKLSFEYPIDIRVLEIPYPRQPSGINCIFSLDFYNEQDIIQHVGDNDLPSQGFLCVAEKKTYETRAESYASHGYDPHARPLHSGLVVIIDFYKPELSVIERTFQEI